MRNKARNTRALIITVLCISVPWVANSEPVTREQIDKAQLEMLDRVGKEIDQYAKKIDIDPEFVGYCKSELYLRGYDHPANGQIPFGINYNNINTSEHLESVLSVRESYEKSFLKLCLAKAKNALSESEK